MTQQTLGQFRVGTTFNPSNDTNVDKIKALAADLIDVIDGLPSQDAEQARLKALAMTAIEDGAMWGVKAATKQPLPDHLYRVRPHASGGHSSTGPAAKGDPFDAAVREVVIDLMGSLGPWPKVMSSWQVLDVQGALAKRGFAQVTIVDIDATLQRIRAKEDKK